MESNGGVPASEIQRQIKILKSSKDEIERQISALEAQLEQLNYSENNHRKAMGEMNSNDSSSMENGSFDFGHGLASDMIYRYSRQLLLPSFGVQGQANLLKSSVLVIGAGGLGSPALLYLAACGVGRIGIVDHDVVELNNLHRQIIHAEAYIGRSKVESAAAACRAINSTVEIVEHKEAFRTTNALEIVRKYDIVVDATDNVPSRYMINDCCVVSKKPLISGAALGLEGQVQLRLLKMLNFNSSLKPLLTCMQKHIPLTSSIVYVAHSLQLQWQSMLLMLISNSTTYNSMYSGVLGVVPGVIWCLEALEAIKIASAVGDPLSGRMLLFDALSGRIRTAPLKLNLLPVDARISSEEYHERVVKREPHVLVDVRPAHHYKIVSLPKFINIPLPSLGARLPGICSALENKESMSENKNKSTDLNASLYDICRRGNDFQRAVQYLHKNGINIGLGYKRRP